MSPFRRLLGYAIRYRKAFLTGLLCVIVTQGVSLASPMVLRYTIDDLTRAAEELARLAQLVGRRFGIAEA